MGEPVSRRRAVTALVAGALGAGLAGLLWTLPGALPGAGAQEDPPSTTSTSIVTGNPTCAQLGGFEFEFRIEFGNELPEVGAEFRDPATGFMVTITDVDVVAGRAVFSFESTIPVSAVFVKAGPGGILYTFDPPTTSGIGLVSPRSSISHLSFCWNAPPPTTTTTTTTTAPPTTPTTPTTAPPTTSTTPTTTPPSTETPSTTR